MSGMFQSISPLKVRRKYLHFFMRSIPNNPFILFWSNSPRYRKFSSIEPLQKHYAKYNLNANTYRLTTLKEVEKALEEIEKSRKFQRMLQRKIDDSLSETYPFAGSASATESLMVIRSCGEAIPEEPPEKRIQLMHKIWDAFEELGTFARTSV